MTPEQFAAKVRAKYPNGRAADGRSYAEIPDQELTQKIVEKYPVYAKQIKQPAPAPAPQKSLGQKVLDAGTKVAKVTGFEGTADYLGTNIARMTNAASALRKDTTVEQALERSKNIPQTNLKQAAGAGLQLGSLVSGPISSSGASLARGLLSGAAAGAASLGGQAAAEDKSAGTVVKQAALGGALGAAVEGVGRTLKGVAKKAYEVVLPKSKQEAQMLQAYKANKPFLERIAGAVTGTNNPPRLVADTAFDQGMTGTEGIMGVQAKRAQSTIWNGIIKPNLDAVKEPVKLDTLFGAARKEIIETTPELTRQKALLTALDSVVEDYADAKPVSLSQLQDIKKGWAEFVPEKAYRGESIAGALNEVRDTLAGLARKTIYETVPDPAVRQAYIDHGNLEALAELGQKAMTNAGLKGGTGQLLSSIAERTLVPIATIAGQTLYKAGDGIQLIGRAGLSSVGQFIDDLTSGSSPQSSPDTTPQTDTTETLSSADTTTLGTRVNDDGSITTKGPFSGKEMTIDPNAVGGTIKGAGAFAKQARAFLKRQPKPELLDAITDYNNWYDWGVLPQGEKSGTEFLTTFQKMLKEEGGIDLTGATKDKTARFTNAVEELISRIDKRWAD